MAANPGPEGKGLLAQFRYLLGASLLNPVRQCVDDVVVGNDEQPRVGPSRTRSSGPYCRLQRSMSWWMRAIRTCGMLPTSGQPRGLGSA